MTKPACPRSFEAEALRDGRLTGAELLGFRRHLDSCSHCSREVAALQALAERLCNSGFEADADELHVRRERTRLLAAFDAKLVPPEPAPAARGWLLGAAAASLLALVLCVYLGVRSGVRAGGESAVLVQAQTTAAWSRRSEGAVEKILLERGSLSIRVDHALKPRRLLVVLPDGELEDIGTRFTVSAEAGRTTAVRVESGRVVLRIRGQAPLSLRAGDAWQPSQPLAVSSCPSCEPMRGGDAASAPQIQPSAAPLLPLTSARAPRLPAASVMSSRAASPLRSADHSVNPSLDFRAAMAALDSGDNGTAAARFANFLSTHPLDARCEDAAYLRVIAMQRAGDAGRMREAAAHYLRQYPNGFRHAEVAALAR